MQERESTDEHNTDAPSIDRGLSAATDNSRPRQRACSARPDRQSATCRASTRNSGQSVSGAQAQAGGQASQESRGSAPEAEGAEEVQEACGEGGQPQRPRARQDDEPQGQGAEVGQEEALSVAGALSVGAVLGVRL